MTVYFFIGHMRQTKLVSFLANFLAYVMHFDFFNLILIHFNCERSVQRPQMIHCYRMTHFTTFDDLLDKVKQ